MAQEYYNIEKILNEGHFCSSIIGTEYFDLSLKIYNKLFDKTIPLRINNIPSQNLGTQIYLRIEKVANLSFSFDEAVKSAIEENLWQGYNLVCENAQNPIDENSIDNNKELNMKFYGIHSIEELLEKTNLVSMSTMAENYEKEDEEIYTSLYFNSEWIGDGLYEICLQGNEFLYETHHQ